MASLIIKGVGTVIGLGTEAVAHHKEKKKAKTAAAANAADLSPSPSSSSFAVEQQQQQQQQQRQPDLSDLSPQSTGDEKAHFKKGLESDDDDEEDIDYDDEDWALDDAAAELMASGVLPPSYEESQVAESSARTASPPESPAAVEKGEEDEVKEVVGKLRKAHPAAFIVNAVEEAPLPCPVIIPQRRPKQKSRGFVRAYPPVLGECKGIDQDTFMAFLKDFDQSSKASPVFDAFNIAAMIVGFVPGPITMGVSIAVQILANTGKEIQNRKRTNTYLNAINESLFMPHGLYCMVMTYKPNQHQRFVSVDMNQDITKNITKSLDVPDSQVRNKLKNLKISSGVSHGEFSLPEAAPLIYPTLDAAAVYVDKPLDEKKQNKLKSSGKFIAEYMDRRGQATFAAQNPTNKLATMPEKKFSSPYADPNSAVYNGGLISFLTGGVVDPRGARRSRRAMRDQYYGYGRSGSYDRRRRGPISGLVHAISNSQSGPSGYSRNEMEDYREVPPPPRRRERKGLLKRILGQDVLYLMICNLPTEEEMELAKEQIRLEKANKSSNLFGR